MALIDESLVSDPRKQKWVDEISKILTHQLTIPFEKISHQPSIFQVPEKLAAEKPEAYEPQHIGLGPNHHFRPQPYKRMEQKKLTVVQSVLQDRQINGMEQKKLVVQSVLQDRQINDFKVVIDKIRKLVPLVRACYDVSLQDEDDSLAWVFAIDGVFLLEVIRNNNDGIFHFPSIQDLLMIENQIPCEVLKEIDEALMQPSSGTSTDIHYIFSPSVFRAFSLTHSPLDLCAISEAPTNVKHLLDYMYQSIIKKASLALVPEMVTPTTRILAGRARKSADAIFKIPVFVDQISKEKIAQIYEQTITTLEMFSQSRTPIPSASKYHQRAGIRFCNLNSDQGIKNIYIDGEKFVLPSLTLSKVLEVVLRNLVAYEILVADEFPLTEYVSLMCRLIKNTSDVKLLRKEKIIIGDLDDDEVVKLFTGMSSSTIRTEKRKKEKSELTRMIEKSELTRMIEKANNVYERAPIMKASFLMKKLASWLLLILKAIGGFVERSWKIVAFIISIGTVILLTLQAYCDTYGCEKTNDTLLSYVSR